MFFPHGLAKDSGSSVLVPVGSAMRERIILLASQLVAASADQSQRNNDGTPRRTAILKAMCTTLRSLPLAMVRPAPVRALDYATTAPSTADTWSDSFDLARHVGVGGRGRAAELASARLARTGSDAAAATPTAPAPALHWLDDFPELNITTMSSHGAAGSAGILAAEEEANDVILCLDALLGNERKRAAAHDAHVDNDDEYKTPKQRKAGPILTATLALAPRDDDPYGHFDATLSMSELEGMIGGIASGGAAPKPNGATPLYRPASEAFSAMNARVHAAFEDDWMAVLESTTGVSGGCGHAERGDSRTMSTPPTSGGALLSI
jgi:hypothetical protein